MVDWSSIPIAKQIISGLSYLKKYFDLNAKEKQLKKLEQELNYLNKIREENSTNYESMVDFNLVDLNNINIQAGDNEPSPHLEFIYSISNRSIFDLKIKKIRIKLYLNNYGELGEVNTSDIEIEFRDIKLDFEGDRVFSISPHSFRFEMPMKKINVTI